MQSPREIVQAAIDAGWTQSKIAAESGVPQATISRILSGENDPRFSTVEKLLAIKVKKPRRPKAAPPPAVIEDAPAEQEAA